MHLRNSWTRSMSSCCQRHSSCGSSPAAWNGGIALVDLVVPGDVGDEVADERERPHRLDRDRLALREVRQPRLAHEARPAVDLGAARAALGRLAVPADGEVRGLCAWIQWMASRTTIPSSDGHAELVEGALVPGSRGRPEVGVGHQVTPSRSRLRSSSGIFGTVRRCRPPCRRCRAGRRCSACPTSVAVRVVEPAVGAAALRPLARAAGDRLGHDQHVAQLEDEVPGGVVGAAAADPDDGQRVRASSSGVERRLEVLGASGRCRPATASSPGAPRGAGAGPRRRSARTARPARPAPPGPRPGRARARPARVAACAAAAAPVRCPNTSRSDRELPPRRFAPCIPPATSPAA